MFPHYFDRAVGAWNGKPRISLAYHRYNNELRNTKGHAQNGVTFLTMAQSHMLSINGITGTWSHAKTFGTRRSSTRASRAILQAR